MTILGLGDAGVSVVIGMAVVGESSTESTYGKPEHSLKSTTHGALHCKHSSLELPDALCDVMKEEIDCSVGMHFMRVSCDIHQKYRSVHRT